MKKDRIWQFIADRLRRHVPIALLAVVESEGASPGKAGFKMAVAANGERYGTIGGGVMEVNWVEKSVELLSLPEHTGFVKKLFHSKETKHEPSGLICSGWQTILFRTLRSDSLSIVEEIAETLRTNRTGRLTISSNAISFHPNQKMETDFTFTYKDEHNWMYEEHVGILDTVYIVGSGHVGLALSHIMATLDFNVVVIDDRPDVETFVTNTFALTKLSAPYSTLGDIVEGTDREYVAIVTTAYKTDEAALKAIIHKNVRYVGLMGSEAKASQIFRDLKSEGIAEERFSRIHTPIGIPIASHTPEEIAISIAAEIIKHKNESVQRE